MPLESFDPRMPFCRADAVAHGVTDRQLASTAYRRIFPGVYVDSDIPDTLVTRARAALIAAPPGGVLTHGTSARLWSGQVPEDPKIHVSYSRNVSTPPDGIMLHRFREPLDVAWRHGLPVTSLGMTFVHCAVRLDLVDMVVLGDRFARRRPERIVELVEYAESWRGQGGRRARIAASLVRPGVDSGPETKVRLLMTFGGLCVPTPDVWVRDADGEVRYRLDLAHEEVRLAIEYDGRWHQTAQQRAYDAVRRAALESEDWRVVVLTHEDLYETPLQTLELLHGEQAARGIPVPARLSDGWRRHFAVRSLAPAASAI